MSKFLIMETWFDYQARFSHGQLHWIKRLVDEESQSSISIFESAFGFAA